MHIFLLKEYSSQHETLLVVYTFVCFSVYFCIHLLSHNLLVLNKKLSDNVLYLETFTFKLAKHKVTTKMLRKPHSFYSLSHINAQFMVSARFLIDNFFLVSLEIDDLYLTFRFKTSAVFYVFTVTIGILLNHVDNNMTYL